MWGEAVVVKKQMDGKTFDKGRVMMFVGYPANPGLDSVRMWIDANRVVVTCNVILSSVCSLKSKSILMTWNWTQE